MQSANKTYQLRVATLSHFLLRRLRRSRRRKIYGGTQRIIRLLLATIGHKARFDSESLRVVSFLMNYFVLRLSLFFAFRCQWDNILLLVVKQELAAQDDEAVDEVVQKALDVVLCHLGLTML